MARFSCVLITCVAASAWTGVSDSSDDTNIDFHDDVDEVTLLQATAEMKKADAVAAQHKEAQESTFHKDDSYPDLRGDCASTYSTPSSAGMQSGEIKHKTTEAKILPKVEPGRPVDTSADIEGVPAPALTPGQQLLSVLVGALFIWYLKAGLDRTNQKPAEHKRIEPDREAWNLLLDSALAADEKAFDKAFKRVSEEGTINLDSWGCTALHFAAKGGSVKIVKHLLDHGLWVDSEDAWDETPLHIAARAGHMEVCEHLLSAGARIDILNAEDRTPLVVAGWANHTDVCRFLLDRGAGSAGMTQEELPPIVSEMLALEQSQDQPLDKFN